MRVLVIEDQEDLRFLIGSMLEISGHEVETAATGVEGLAAIDGADVILLDLRLPDRDGLEILGDIPPEARQRVIVMSALDDDDETLRAAVEAGAASVLSKPFKLADLRAKLDTVTAN